MGKSYKITQEELKEIGCTILSGGLIKNKVSKNTTVNENVIFIFIYGYKKSKKRFKNINSV